MAGARIISRIRQTERASACRSSGSAKYSGKVRGCASGSALRNRVLQIATDLRRIGWPAYCIGLYGGLVSTKEPGEVRSRTPSLGTLRPDYVVVGAGAAGCVIAGRLSQILPDARIALIEAGGERLGLTTKIPGTAFKPRWLYRDRTGVSVPLAGTPSVGLGLLEVIASTFPRRNWNFQTEPVPALNGRRLSWFQGRILGGSSSINGMLYLRGHSLEYNQWAQLGCHGWSFDQVLPYERDRNADASEMVGWPDA